ncbi:MAG: NAD(P)H-binding protein [Myxococcales bacterium]
MSEHSDQRPVLVTGATGNVGREVVRALQSRKISFVAGDRHLERARQMLGDEVRVVALDFRKPETYRAAVAGVRGVFLLRPPPIANVQETLNVLADTAVEAGAEHIVFLSVIGADRQRWVPHHKVEQHLLHGRAAWTFLRPGFFAQNCSDAYRRDILEDDRIYVPAGGGKVSFVDVRDVAEVAAVAFENPALRNRALELTGPEAVGFDQVASLLSSGLGRSIRYQPASIVGYLRHLRRRGMVWGQAGIQTLLHVGLRFGNGAPLTSTVQEVLGRPARSMETYVHDHLHLWKQ